MIVYDVATKVLNTGSFPQHSITGLISGITFIVLLSQEKPLRWKKIKGKLQKRSGTLKFYRKSVEITAFLLGLISSSNIKAQDIWQIFM